MTILTFKSNYQTPIERLDAIRSCKAFKTHNIHELVIKLITQVIRIEKTIIEHNNNKQ
jgi:hypothetical protein